MRELKIFVIDFPFLAHVHKSSTIMYTRSDRFDHHTSAAVRTGTALFETFRSLSCITHKSEESLTLVDIWSRGRQA